MMATKFNAWVRNARRGEKIVYYRGYLPDDRFVDAGAKAVAVEDVARAAWSSYLEDEVLLTQRRFGYKTYEYIATKT